MARRLLRRFSGILRNVILGSPIRNSIMIPVTGPDVSVEGNFLKEDGDALLLETGDNLLLEG